MDQKPTAARDSPPTPAKGAHDADLLDGWKDIADHLGKSVRTAQRWEAEFNLPVHRLGRRDGEGIYAYRSEIDKWRRPSSEQEPQQPTGHASESEQPGAQAGARLTPGRGRRFWRIAGVILFVVVVAVLTASLLRPSGQPASLRATPRGFAAFDADGRRLWEKQLQFPHTVGMLESDRPMSAFGDVDGDGDTEVLAAIASGGFPVQLRCYASDGRERWTYRPTDVVVFGGARVGAPHLASLLLHQQPDGSSVPYVVSVHQSQFPALVSRLGPDGTPTARYWSAGHVTALRVMRIGDRNWVLVGTPHNETKGGSLAVFDERRFGGSAPARNDAYRCTTCPPGAPDFFFVFPRTSISRLFGFAPVSQINPDDDGFSVSVRHHSARLPGYEHLAEAFAHYRFNDRFELIAGDYVAGYYMIESFLVAEKLIPRATAQQDKHELWPVEVWSAGRWTSVTR